MVQIGYHHPSKDVKIGYQIHGDQSGSQVPLVLIMGLSGILEDWSPLTEELGRSRPVLVFDHRGIGRSTISPDADPDLSHDIMCDDLLSLLGSLGSKWSTVDILGFSMGGHILQRLATRESTKTDSKGLIDLGKGGIKARKLILAATMTKMPRGDINLEQMGEEAGKIQDFEERAYWMTEQMLHFQYDDASLANNHELEERKRLRIQVSNSTRRPRQTIGMQVIATSQLRLTEKDLGRIPSSVPVMIIHGKRDRMVHYPESDKMEQWIKHSKRVDLSDGPAAAQRGEYAHFWYDYFGTDYWASKINAFLDASPAKL